MPFMLTLLNEMEWKPGNETVLFINPNATFSPGKIRKSVSIVLPLFHQMASLGYQVGISGLQLASSGVQFASSCVLLKCLNLPITSPKGKIKAPQNAI